MTEPLLPARALFRFAAPLVRRALPGEAPFKSQGLALESTFRLPCFEELEERRVWAELRGCWSPEGLAFALAVDGKHQAPLGDEDHPTQGDGLQLWIDTRDTKSIHRASRFCHHFVLLPNAGGRRPSSPLAVHQFIHRAKEHPQRAEPEQFRLRLETRRGGYLLEVIIRALALTGYDPLEHPRLGFTYLVQDRELGQQTFSCPTSLPFREDPSLWGTLELVE